MISNLCFFFFLIIAVSGTPYGDRPNKERQDREQAKRTIGKKRKEAKRNLKNSVTGLDSTYFKTRSATYLTFHSKTNYFPIQKLGPEIYS